MGRFFDLGFLSIDVQLITIENFLNRRLLGVRKHRRRPSQQRCQDRNWQRWPG